jgi:S-adenosylmethionine:tRNA ribosyltransferase-isomerase
MDLSDKNNIAGLGEIRTQDFSYELPDERIAKYPLAERESSRLLVWENGDIRQGVFYEAEHFIPANSLLVFNNTRVVRARLIFHKESGARIEIFCLEPFTPADYQVSFGSQGPVEWRCIVGNAKKWKTGKLEKNLTIGGTPVCLAAETATKESNTLVIRFSWDQPFSFAEIIEQAGFIPIPPYLNRESDETDQVRYQTVYAKIKGSVAAPTAGLHFTETILEKLHRIGIRTEELTLHVGAGTFQPVKSDTIAGHEMHRETVVVPLTFLKKLALHEGKIIAVGTTSVRSLESLYWLGVQITQGKFSDEHSFVSQWEAYQPAPEMTWNEAVGQIIHFLESQNLSQLVFSTQIIIVPGYRFRIIDGMFTNFHQPQSTLLLLIGAFLGDDWRRVYEFALTNGFRFLSYGDSNLYLR